METINYKGYTIQILLDNDPESPREWDNLGTMYCLHKRYNLGDKHNLDSADIRAMAESQDYISLPIYMYDHSGIAINTVGFSCPWDSGQLGIIAVSLDKVKAEYNHKRISKKLVEKVKDNLRTEVETYNKYLAGNVYGYQIENAEGDNLDSCWGFYDQDYCIKEAKSQIDYFDKNTPKQLNLELTC